MDKLLQQQAEHLNCKRLRHTLKHAYKKRKKREKYSKLSNASSILSKWNEFTLLRLEFAKLYPALKPDDIFQSPYSWILSELTMQAEIRMIEENVAEIYREEQESKNKKK